MLKKIMLLIVITVLFVSLGTPAFANPSPSVEVSDLAQDDQTLIESTNEELDNVIFDNGSPDLLVSWEFTQWVLAEDFVLDEDYILTDFHFTTVEIGEWDGTVQYFLFFDDGGKPASSPFVSGTVLEADLVREPIDPVFNQKFAYWVDLETPVELDAHTTYWFGLHMASDYDNRDNIFWQATSSEIGSFAHESHLGTFDNWFNFSDFRLSFILTGIPELSCGQNTEVNDQNQCVPDLSQICSPGTTPNLSTLECEANVTQGDLDILQGIINNLNAFIDYLLTNFAPVTDVECDDIIKKYNNKMEEDKNISKKLERDFELCNELYP